ncbi:hypothetical protein ILYODFUR_013595 [Ilyodon furcidens]|uniref:Uncharacterized protein n=2 Tax=Goodeidae TaxID=28758 RepID=A0ABV0SN63_9TELE
MQKALQSPLAPTHDGLGTRRKRIESCVGREECKPSTLEIYIATLKARIAGGPCQHGEERGFFMPALSGRKWQSQLLPREAHFVSSLLGPLTGCCGQINTVPFWPVCLFSPFLILQHITVRHTIYGQQCLRNKPIGSKFYTPVQ